MTLYPRVAITFLRVCGGVRSGQANSNKKPIKPIKEVKAQYGYGLDDRFNYTYDRIE